MGKVKGAFTAEWTPEAARVNFYGPPARLPSDPRVAGRPKAWRAWMAWNSLWKVRGDVGGRAGGKKKRVDDEIRTRAC